MANPSIEDFEKALANPRVRASVPGVQQLTPEQLRALWNDMPHGSMSVPTVFAAGVAMGLKAAGVGK